MATTKVTITVAKDKAAFIVGWDDCDNEKFCEQIDLIGHDAAELFNHKMPEEPGIYDVTIDAQELGDDHFDLFDAEVTYRTFAFTPRLVGKDSFPVVNPQA